MLLIQKCYSFRRIAVRKRVESGLERGNLEVWSLKGKVKMR